jgi:hypothetical protein
LAELGGPAWLSGQAPLTPISTERNSMTILRAGAAH